ncbi:MAG: RNA-binding transcriptional accessory protein, partial [Myxococcales bacterium]|nr:RNA-binding transcriptional accessory protein [Myxococcales bacterium]
MTQLSAHLSAQHFTFIKTIVTKQLGHTSVKALPTKKQVQTCMQLFHEGATIPFIARYRKERTDQLDEVQLRALDLALKALESLETRRSAILKRLKERQQEGSSIPSAAIEAICSAQSLPLLEELYAPYKSKRLSKADQARNAGLDTLIKLV